MSGLGSRLSTYWHKNGPINAGVVTTSSDQTPNPCVPWIKLKREGVESGRSGAYKLDNLALSRKVNICSDADTGGLLRATYP